MVTGAGEGHSAQASPVLPAMAGSLSLMVWSVGVVDSCRGGGGGAALAVAKWEYGPWISRRIPAR